MADEYGSNLSRLRKEGIISEEGVSRLDSEQRERIESLSEAEVNALIDVYKKVGPVDFGARLI
jgi:hypothetical protein